MKYLVVTLALAAVVGLGAGVAFSQGDVIANEIAQGASAEQIYRNALARGLTPAQVVTQMVEAGLPPGEVVAAAIAVSGPALAPEIALAAARAAATEVVLIAWLASMLAPSQAMLVRAELTNAFPDQAAGIAQSVANALAGVQPPGVPVVALPGFLRPTGGGFVSPSQ